MNYASGAGELPGTPGEREGEEGWLCLQTRVLAIPQVPYLVVIYLHRLNMELDLQSLFGLLCPAVLIG